MATYRLIHREASTGVRSSGLDDLTFRVWIQYMLLADDYGVCPAVPQKFQGDNPRLAKVAVRKLTQAIDALIRAGLVGRFTDGDNQYLYQPDWQDWQRLKHFTTTTYPPIPTPILAQCSEKTREIFSQHPVKLRRGFSPHARASDAHAHADANADANAVETTAPLKPLISGEARPGTWGRIHSPHVTGFCDWVCFPELVFNDFVRRVVAAGTPDADAQADVTTWAKSVRQAWQGQIPGDDIFEFWRHEWKKTHGSNKPAAGGVDLLAGFK